MEWLSTRWQFVRGMQHSWPVRLLWWVWLVLSALSTLSLVFPQIRQYVPPWYVWAIGFLLISLVAAIEGGFRQVQMLKGVYDPLKLSLVLSTLPVYAQDVKIEILCLARGLGYLEMTEETIFLQLEIFSLEDVGIQSFKIGVSAGENNHEGDAVSNLSDWTLVKEREVPIPYNKWQFTDLEENSLWGEIRTQGLKSGIHRTGWVALRIGQSYRDIVKELTRVKISLQRVGSRNLYRFTFREWEECKNEILSREMKQHRFGA
jgi:hypothetical protein